MRTISLICAFFMIALSNLDAACIRTLDKYKRILESIDFQPETTCFYLSDGTVYISHLIDGENEILRLWKTGDTITVVPRWNHTGLILRNEDAEISYLPKVMLTLDSVMKLPTIEKIVKIMNPYFDFFDVYISLRGCLQSMIRMLCCYKFAISSQKNLGILMNIAKFFCELIANFSKQIIRSNFVNIL